MPPKGKTPSRSTRNVKGKGKGKKVKKGNDSSVEIVDENLLIEPSHKHHGHKIKLKFMEKVREFCAQLDVFAAAHSTPVHVICIIIATGIIPIAAAAIVWDLLAAITFEIPDLSTINAPGFVLVPSLP